MKKKIYILLAIVAILLVCAATTMTVNAEENMSEEQFLDMYANAKTFDPAYYSENNPDVKAVYGYADYALYYHYSAYGEKEGRVPCEGAAGGEFVKWSMTPLEAYIKVTNKEYGISESELWAYLFGDNVPWSVRQAEIDKRLANRKDTKAVAPPANNTVVDGIIPINNLANYNSLKKSMTDEEFQAAYNAALQIVQPLVGLSQEEQAKGIFSALRSMADNGTVSYSEEAAHYNDAYGYLINHVASCAGSARTTGLCLNMLGMSYEHVNENQWNHQWCRVNIGGVIWIVDPYGYVCAPETAPYSHPYV